MSLIQKQKGRQISPKKKQKILPRLKPQKIKGKLKIQEEKQFPKLAYIVSSIEKRFLVLYTFIKNNRKQKVIILFNSQFGAKFAEEALQSLKISSKIFIGEEMTIEEKESLDDFCNSPSGVLLCTTPFLSNLSSVDSQWIIQYDPPTDINEYASFIKAFEGEAQHLLFTTDEEFGLIRNLRSLKVDTELLGIEESKIMNVQCMIEDLVKTKHSAYLAAKQAYSWFIRIYCTHPCSDIYDVSQLSIKKLALSFGFLVPPYVDITAMKQETAEEETCLEPKMKRKRKENIFFVPFKSRKRKNLE